jgi:selenocysteine lyase/cysteine desulfurase
VLGLRQRFIDLWTNMIGAEPGTLTSAENVTTALLSLVGGLPQDRLRGRTVLVAGDCFPSLHFLLAGLAPRLGFTLRTVPLRPGESWVREEDMIAAWDETVGLALLTFVTSTASYRCELDTLVAHGRRMGSIVGVDVTQGIGLLPYRVDAPQVDFTVSTSLKWIGGASGAGILHVARHLLAECQPELRGWFSQENPFSWDLDAFAFASDARRFDHGTPSALACIGSIPALEWNAAADTEEMLAHNRTLSRRILDAAAELGLASVSPDDDARRGGSVMLRLPEGPDPSSTVAKLRAAGIFVDCRGRILRMSPGSVTTSEGVSRLLVELAGIQVAA